MQYKFIQLLLLLAKRRVVISWMGEPQLERWEADVLEWSVAEEIELGKCRRDEKLEDDLETWRALISRFTEAGNVDGPTTLVESMSLEFKEE